MNNPIEISALHVYPIKSCAGIALEQAEIVRTGMAYDRTWVLLDSQGEVVTQRKRAAQKLALVTPELRENDVIVRCPSEASALSLPLEYRAEGALHELSVWGSKCFGREERPEASAWFSRVLGFEVRLLRFERSLERVVDPVTVGNSLARAEFQDGYPLLVISEESLQGLNRMLRDRDAPPVDMARFRPNIVVRGIREFGEDQASGLEGITTELNLSFPKRCSRCVMVNVEQSTAEVPQLPAAKHPLGVLAAERMFQDAEGKRKPGFGQNAVIDTPLTFPLRIKIGDQFALKAAGA